MNMRDPRASIRSSARELIERHGKEATSIARQRANSLGEGGSSPEHDAALLVLSAVEQLAVKLSDRRPS